MQTYPSNIDILGLRTDAALLLLHRDSTGVLMAYRQSIHITDLEDKLFIRDAIAEISKLRNLSPLYLMVNTLLGGVTVPPHTDTLKAKCERWHLPIQTDEKSTFWSEETGEIHMKEGLWHGPIKYWEPHSIKNLGTLARTHLVVDLKI